MIFESRGDPGCDVDQGICHYIHYILVITFLKKNQLEQIDCRFYLKVYCTCIE